MKRIKKNSTVEKVLEYLQENGTIDRDTAMEKFGVYNLSSVIRQLRERGYDITDRKIKNSLLKRWTLHKVEEPIVVVEPKEQEFWAIVAIYKSTSGAISFRLDQTLFPSEEDADAYGVIARDNDPEMCAYDVQQMLTLANYDKKLLNNTKY